MKNLEKIIDKTLPFVCIGYSYVAIQGLLESIIRYGYLTNFVAFFLIVGVYLNLNQIKEDVKSFKAFINESVYNLFALVFFPTCFALLINAWFEVATILNLSIVNGVSERNIFLWSLFIFFMLFVIIDKERQTIKA